MQFPTPSDSDVLHLTWVRSCAQCWRNLPLCDSPRVSDMTGTGLEEGREPLIQRNFGPLGSLDVRSIVNSEETQRNGA